MEKRIKNIKNIAVLTSGGDAPGMNAALRAVVRTAISKDINVFGIYEGFKGLVEANFTKLTSRTVGSIMHKAGTILKTSRYEAFQDPTVRAQAIENLKTKEIDGLVVIGGNGSFHGAKCIAEESDISVIGIPATIDNDVNATDLTIGFSSCLHVVSNTLDAIRSTGISHNRIFVVQVMGRNAGDIALHAGMACGAESIIIPEKPFHLEQVVERISSSQKAKKSHSLIIVAEGVMKAEQLAEQLRECGIGCHCDDCGYAQRGGIPTIEDRILATKMGVEAVNFLLEGETNIAVASVQGAITITSLHQAIQQKNNIDLQMLEMADLLSSM